MLVLVIAPLALLVLLKIKRMPGLFKKKNLGERDYKKPNADAKNLNFMLFVIVLVLVV